MLMQTEDWIDLIKEANLTAQGWHVLWSQENAVAAIRSADLVCPLCALANEVLGPASKVRFETAFVWAIKAAFGEDTARGGADDVATAADVPLNRLPPSLKLVRLALGQVLGIPQEKL